MTSRYLFRNKQHHHHQNPDFKMSGSAQNPGAKPQVHSDNDPVSSTKSSHTTSSSDNAAAAAAAATATEGGSGEDPQEASGSSERPATASPEPNCAICLGQLENKSFTDSCFHMFCFVCLQEWSKVKAECPLCKQPFKSIIHNVKSYNNYDQFYLEHQQHRPTHQPVHFGWNLDRSFHYRTTLTMDHRYFNLPNYNREVAARQPTVPMFRRTIMPRYRLRSRTVHPLVRPYPEPVSTSSFRRQIYESGRRASGLSSVHRRRRASPEFFTCNPAQVHRLVPWLNRELNALLYNATGQVSFVMELIVELIKRFRIDSDEFYEHIHPYLHNFTRPFMHEFLHFAEAPYTMQTYDTKVIYQEPSHTVSSSDSSASDSDVVVVDDDDEEPRGGVASSSEQRFRHAGTSSPWHSPPTSGIPYAAAASSTSLARSRWDSPTPGPSWDLSGNSSHSPVNVDGSSDSDASTIIDPTYVDPEPSRSQPTRPVTPDSSDTEEVIFLSYDKPWEERSPIQLSSASDSERSHFIKALKQENNKRKKARSLSETNRRSRDRARERSRSPSPPVHSSTGAHQSSSGHHPQASSSTSAGSSKSRQDRHKKKSHHQDEEDETHRSSSRSSHKEKRKSSLSHTASGVPPKKRRHDEEDNEDTSLERSTSQKKHKPKKHKKTKDRRDKRSKRHQHVDIEERTGNNSPGPLEGAAASLSVSTERADHCKKHPSGHKKSQVKNTGDGGDGGEAKEGGSGHHSDGLLSDNSSSSSGHGTSSTTCLTDSGSDPNPGQGPPSKRFSRQQRVEQVLQERRRMTRLPAVPTLLDLPPSWENISRIASILASRSPSQLVPMPGPSQSSDDPVIISTSSDESEAEDPSRRDGAESMSSDSMPVAKTVVVPCSSNPEIPTAAIDFTHTLASTSAASRPLVVDDTYIDVESISSEEETSDLEVVDVESVSDSSSEPSDSSKTSHLPWTDPEAANTSASNPSVSGSIGGKRTALVDGGSTSGVSGKGKRKRTLSPLSVSALKQARSPKGQKSTSHVKNPFSIDYILRGNPSRSALFSRQKSHSRSSQPLSLSGQDVAHSQTQSESTSTDRHIRQHGIMSPLSAFYRYPPQQREEAAQPPLSSVVSQLSQENQAQRLTEYTAGEDKDIDVISDSLGMDCHSVPSISQESAENLPALPSMAEWVGQSSSSSGSGQTNKLCFPSSPQLSQPGSEGPSLSTVPVISQHDTENLSDRPHEVRQNHPENSENSVKGKEMELSVENSTGENCVSNHESASKDLKDFSDKDMDFGCIADGQERKGKESVVKKLTDTKRSEEEDGNLSSDVDEHVEKLLLCEDVSSCVPDPSDQEKKINDHPSDIGAGEQSNDCKLPTDAEGEKERGRTINQSGSAAAASSEVHAGIRSSSDDVRKDLHSSFADLSSVAESETNSGSSATTSMQNSPDAVGSPSMIVPSSDVTNWRWTVGRY
ncbi:hypothetical protein ACOMHN_040515 [Nucella lapillus]